MSTNEALGVPPLSLAQGEVVGPVGVHDPFVSVDGPDPVVHSWSERWGDGTTGGGPLLDHVESCAPGPGDLSLFPSCTVNTPGSAGPRGKESSQNRYHCLCCRVLSHQSKRFLPTSHLRVSDVRPVSTSRDQDGVFCRRLRPFTYAQKPRSCRGECL